MILEFTFSALEIGGKTDAALERDAGYGVGDCRLWNRERPGRQTATATRFDRGWDRGYCWRLAGRADYRRRHQAPSRLSYHEGGWRNQRDYGQSGPGSERTAGFLGSNHRKGRQARVGSGPWQIRGKDQRGWEQHGWHLETGSRVVSTIAEAGHRLFDLEASSTPPRAPQTVSVPRRGRGLREQSCREHAGRHLNYSHWKRAISCSRADPRLGAA